MRQELIAALKHRIAVFADTGDAGPVLDSAALAEAAELRRLATETVGGHQALPLEEGHTLAYLHWCRYLALPDGQDREDYEASLEFFGALAAVDPRLVPEQIRNQVVPADPNTDRIRRVFTRLGSAYQLFEKARTDNDPTALDAAIEWAREAVTLVDADADSQERARVLAFLSELLSERSKWLDSHSDLEEAVVLRRAALAATDPDTEEYLGRLRALDELTWRRYEHGSRPKPPR